MLKIISVDFNVWHLRHETKNAGRRFVGLNDLKRYGWKVEKDRYGKACQEQRCIVNILPTDTPEDISANALDHIYILFNTGAEVFEKIRALSISDVVTIEQPEEIRGAYFCDCEGWRKIEDWE